ncbi:MAG: hypothetical protein QXT91_00570 [Candidatus Caldarchaeum sp.]
MDRAALPEGQGRMRRAALSVLHFQGLAEERALRDQEKGQEGL